jgi:putative methyltransferase (TIGR04325 family)
MGLKNLMPPFLYRELEKNLPNTNRWAGDYNTWQEALNACKPYDAEGVVEKVKEASLKVKNGEADYESDSVRFNKKIEYAWPILTGLLWVAARNSGILNAVDIKGAFGRLYFQNQTFLKLIPEVKWTIIEETKFVEIGKKYFETQSLAFHDELETVLHFRPNVVLFSGTLQYLEDPFSVLDQVISAKVPHIIINDIPFIKGHSDRLTVQTVPSHIYDAAFPSWFFSEMKLLKILNLHYDIVADFKSRAVANLPSTFKGLILMKKK